MSTAVQDRDAIVARAITIASAEEREAYLTQACGGDVALRREVEEKVAAHLQGGNQRQTTAPAAPGALPARPAHQPAAAHPSGRHQLPRSHKQARRLMAALMLVVAATSLGVAVWAWRAKGHAQQEAQQAGEERDQARKEAEVARTQQAGTEVELEAVRKARDAEVGTVQKAERNEADTREVLKFLQAHLLAAGRPADITSAEGKDVTLRQAVDAAAGAVGRNLRARPLAEASVRELLGSIYLDLKEPALAVEQLERALALREAILGSDSSATGECRNRLAVAYKKADRTDDANRLFKHNANLPSHAAALAIQGARLLTQDKPALAEAKLRESLTIRQRTHPDDWTTFDVKSLLGEALLVQKKYADAEPLLLSGYEGMKQRAAKMPPDARENLTQALERLVRLYEAWGKEDKVVQWRKALEAATKP